MAAHPAGLFRPLLRHVAVELGRRAILCELNLEYVQLIRKRMATVQPPLPGMESSSRVSAEAGGEAEADHPGNEE